MLAYVIQGIAYGFAAAMQPGPFQTYLISQTLSHGWRRTLPAVLAPLISDGPIIVLVLLVLSRMPAWWVQLLQMAGGMFVLYLAVGIFKVWQRLGSRIAAVTQSSQRSVLKAALVNLLNPGPYLYWSLVTGPILLMGWRQAPANGIGMLVGFYLTIIVGFGAIILLFAAASRMGQEVHRVLLLVSALALACFGLYHVGIGIMELIGGTVESLGSKV
ncbi:MAG: LysE family transporter [Thermodesulfobacteriota bacterium]|jgi:threonine/homoserine/homoserine lactone efflux protein